MQHRLVHLDPESSALVLSWYSTAMYVGIAIAPPIGTLALAAGGAEAVPLAGAVVTVAALAAFLLSFAARAARHSAPVA